MIKAEGLCKSYGHREAIKNVSFNVRQGEIVGFLGPNGAGKTTTMKILTGYMSPTEGRVLIDNQDLSANPIEAKKKMGYLPEVPPLYGDMCVEDYLIYVAHLKQCPKDKIKKLVESACEKAGVTSVKKRWVAHLSKGFKQRVGLAQALVSDPEILVLDEPTVGLDPKQVVEIRKLLSNLRGQHTLILSTHILSEAQLSCDRVIIINEGQIIDSIAMDELSAKLSVKRKLLLKLRKGDKDSVLQLEKVQGVFGVSQQGSHLELEVGSDKSINEEVAQFVVSQKWGLLEMRELGTELEDIFIQLTSGEKK